MRTILAAILISFLTTQISADYIALKNGTSATTDILDTLGCKVKIRRNGNIVEIVKDNIAFVVCQGETLSYSNFKCTPEIVNQTSGKVFVDGYNADRVNELISKLKYIPLKLRKCQLYYISDPINGDDFQCCWSEKFKLFETHLFLCYNNIKQITPDELFKYLSQESNDTNCVLIPFEVRFEGSANNVWGGGSISMGTGGTVNIANASLPGYYGVVTLNIKIIDLKSRNVVYDDTGSGWGVAYGLKKEQKSTYVDAKADGLEKAFINTIKKMKKRFSTNSTSNERESLIFSAF